MNETQFDTVVKLLNEVINVLKEGRNNQYKEVVDFDGDIDIVEIQYSITREKVETSIQNILSVLEMIKSSNQGEMIKLINELRNLINKQQYEKDIFYPRKVITLCNDDNSSTDMIDAINFMFDTVKK